MPEQMVDSVLFQTQNTLGSTNISVFTNKNSRIFVALHCEHRRQAGLNASLAKDGWVLEKGWYIQFDDGYFAPDLGNFYPRSDDPYIEPCDSLDKVWSKHLSAGQTVTFPATQDYMEFAIAIFAKESKYTTT